VRDIDDIVCGECIDVNCNDYCRVFNYNYFLHILNKMFFTI